MTRLPLRDQLLQVRDRWVSNPAFQRWAAGFPLTRLIAHRQARALFDVCAGFVYSQVLLACVELRLFEHLAERPRHLEELAKFVRLEPAAAQRLLAAATSLGLVSKRSERRYGLGQLGAALVGNPALVEMVEHHALVYRDLADPVALLRGERTATELSRYWAYAGPTSAAKLEPDRVAGYTDLMASSQGLIAGDILDAYAFDKHRAMIDLGGGDGTFVRAVARRFASLQLLLVDLPAVAEVAAKRIAEAGLDSRCQAIGGDMFTEPLPAGADLVTLVRVILDHDDAAALEILAAVRKSLPPGGTVLIAEPLSGVPGAEPVSDAYFGFYLLAMGQGRARTFAALRTLLETSGFEAVSAVPTRRPFMTGVVTARAPDRAASV